MSSAPAKWCRRRREEEGEWRREKREQNTNKNTCSLAGPPRADMGTITNTLRQWHRNQLKHLKCRTNKNQLVLESQLCTCDWSWNASRKECIIRSTPSMSREMSFYRPFFLFPSVSILHVPFCFQVAIKSFAKFRSLLTLPLTAAIFMDCSTSCTSLQNITGLPLCVQLWSIWKTTKMKETASSSRLLAK